MWQGLMKAVSGKEKAEAGLSREECRSSWIDWQSVLREQEVIYIGYVEFVENKRSKYRGTFLLPPRYYLNIDEYHHQSLSIIEYIVIIRRCTRNKREGQHLGRRCESISLDKHWVSF